MIPPYILFFKLFKKFRGFKITFANFSLNFLPGINVRENGPKSRKSRKFLPAKVSARESSHTLYTQNKTPQCSFNAAMFLPRRSYTLCSSRDLWANKLSAKADTLESQSVSWGWKLFHGSGICFMGAEYVSWGFKSTEYKRQIPRGSVECCCM